MAEFDPKNCPVGMALTVKIEAAERRAEQSLQAISANIADLRSSIAKDNDEIKKTLDRHSHALFGNDSTGLRTAVINVQDRIERIERDHLEEGRISHSWTLQRWGWIVAIGISVLNALMAWVLR